MMIFYRRTRGAGKVTQNRHPTYLQMNAIRNIAQSVTVGARKGEVKAIEAVLREEVESPTHAQNWRICCTALVCWMNCRQAADELLKAGTPT
jgi:hypothetical protein